MRRLFCGLVIAAWWFFWPPELFAYSEQSYVSRMYEEMAWCLPSDRIADPPRQYGNGTEALFVQIGQHQFVIMVVPPTKYLDFVNVKHPDAQFLRISFPMPEPGDPDQVIQERKMFWQLTTGCFALTQPPR